MFQRGLAYRSRRFVNWCGSCQTVLANEQVENGRCWRCDSIVGRTELDQWFFKITAYASELDAELDSMTGWPERVRVMQRNWIGKSEGAAIRFPILDGEGRPTGDALEVFTTRLDTIFGATFCVVAPRHQVLGRIPSGSEARRRLDEFLRRIDARDVTRAGIEPEEKEGIDTGLRVRNPYNGETLPVWAANFVLMEYGTGAIMAVPAHDERDFEFARKYGLPVRTVIVPAPRADRKSTRLNSSHLVISYAVFCLKKKMIDRVGRLRKHGPDLPREIEGVARAQHLIGDDAERLALARHAQHRLDQVRTTLARAAGDPEESRDPEDHRPLAALAGQTLSCELRLAVDVQGIGRVRFEVRCALAAVEHVVRREVDEGRPDRLADGGQSADRLGVQRERALPVLLRAVDEIVGCGVEDAGRSQVLQGRPRSGGVEDIEIPRAQGNQLGGAFEGLDEIGS